MKKFIVLTNSFKDENYLITNRIKQFLESKGCCCLASVCMPASNDNSHQYTNPDSIPYDTECILVIGGDGTLLHAARDLVSLDIPMLGINSGKLGFLAEVEKTNISDTLERLISGDFQIEKRMMLSGKVVRNGEVLKQSIALNDIVVNRSGSLRVIDLKISVNGQLLSVYSADGIIASTPTGATGYNLSAGGPIAQPSSNIIIMTPICAHTLNSRSIVFSEDAEIEMEICKDKNNVEEGKRVAFDGDFEIELMVGDKIIISKSELYTNIIKLNNMSFIELLGKKMV